MKLHVLQIITYLRLLDSALEAQIRLPLELYCCHFLPEVFHIAPVGCVMHLQIVLSAKFTSIKKFILMFENFN